MRIEQQSGPAESGSQLAEVWGDVVSRPQLGKAILIGATCSVSAYFAALDVIVPLTTTSTIGRAMAMFCGVAGALLGGLLCSLLFPPKRTLVVDRAGSSATWQQEGIENLRQDEGSLGSMKDLPVYVIQEMRAVGLYRAFADFEERQALSNESCDE